LTLPALLIKSPAMNCSVCGREVSQTVHFKDGYKVGYYLEFTGEVEEIQLTNPDNETKVRKLFRLKNPREVITCADCAAKNR
jgi:hypothetical protein